MSSRPSLSLLDLPTELLIEICWQSDNSQLPIVCGHLRDIIHGTPLFWTSMYLGEKQNTPEAVSFLSQRLERGVACPLDIVIRAAVPPNAPAPELWLKLSPHRSRIRTLDIGTDTMVLCGSILHTVLLTPPRSSALPSLQKLDIRHDDEFEISYQRTPMDLRILLRPMASLFPALTTLILPFLIPCIPYLNSPIPSLKMLVLDGTMSGNYPSPYQIIQFLVQTPHLETLWCKDYRVHTYENFRNRDTVAWSRPDDRLGTLPVLKLPILLPRLTKMAVVVPGSGIDLLHAIEAPALQDLHMDGTRDDEYFGHEVEWLYWFPGDLHAGLHITSSRSPALRRLSLVGAYLSRDTWLWLFGCGEMHSLPFPLLQSIALREMKAVKNEVTNTLHDALADLSAPQHEGCIALRRFAYLASEPPLHGVALHNLINAVALKQSTPDDLFELELDGVSSVDIRKQLDGLLSKGVMVCLHEEPPKWRNWWDLEKDVDPTEANSY